MKISLRFLQLKLVFELLFDIPVICWVHKFGCIDSVSLSVSICELFIVTKYRCNFKEIQRQFKFKNCIKIFEYSNKNSY